jgi:hypothetical protein
MTDRSKRVPAIAAAALAAAVFAFTSIGALGALTASSVITIAIPASAIAVDDLAVRASVTDGVPEYQLHWDGQPPSAVLIDTEHDVVVAATAFSDESFDHNRSAVRFVPGEARIKLDARRWTPGTPLALRVEAVRARTWFHLFAVATVLCAAVIVLLMRVRASDAAILLVAAAVFAAFYPGSPIRISDSSDEANINSFAAALDHPEWFTHDRLLSDPSNFSWYIPAYIAIVRAVGALGFHYQTAYAFLAAAIAALLLFGLRRLFTEVSGSARFGVAAAFALALMHDQQIPAGEEWMLVSALPRALFTALLPWVLVLAIRVKAAPRRWWLATLAAGALAHLYPLSAPVLIGALLVAFVVASDKPLPARAGGAAIAASAAIVALLPYILIYTERYASATGSDPAVAARARDLALLGYAHLQPSAVVRQLFEHRVTSLRIFVDVFVLALVVRQGFDRQVRFLVGLAIGFVLVAFALPIIDLAIAQQTGRRPYQIEMVRAVRYLDLFVIGALAVAVRGWRGDTRGGRRRAAVGALLGILALAPGWLTTTRAVLGRARLDWRLLQNAPDAPTAAAQEAVRAVQALRQPGERVAGPVGLRQFGIPLAWTWKDVLLLAYANGPAVLESARATERTGALLAGRITSESLGTIARELDAQLVFVRREQLDDAVARSDQVVFVNAVYALLRVPR